MSHRFQALLLALVASFLFGYFTLPVIRAITGPRKTIVIVTETTTSGLRDVNGTEVDYVPRAVEIDESGSVSVREEAEDDDDGDGFSLADDESTWGASDDEYLVERDVDSYVVTDKPQELKPIEEDKEVVKVDPAFLGLNKPRSSSEIKALWHVADNLAKRYDRAEHANRKNPFFTGYRNENASVADWKNPKELYNKLCADILQKIGDGSPKAVMKYLESPENRLNLARLTLIRKAGIDGIKSVSEQKMGATTLFALGSDLDWITGTLFSGPSENMAKGLSYLALIYSRYPEDLKDPVVRRIASTTATEFAREGWSEKDMLGRFEYYFTSYKQGRLNKIFDDLHYWETRLVCGCMEPGGWGSPVSLTWQRDNVRLPAQEYVSACSRVDYKLRNVAGDSVFSAEYLAPVMKYMKNAVAWAHQEIGGVCGACSHFGAYAALANGIPAMTMGEPGHCAYTVRPANEWQKSFSIYWQHGMHKTFWRMHDWDFLILMQDLYTDRYATQVSDHLLAAAEFLASRKMEKPAMQCFEAATAAQPLNWPAWVGYASYVKQKAPKDALYWRSINDRIVATVNVKFHNVAATFLTNYVYPNLLPLMPKKNDRNKMFAEFFKNCNDFGTNRWDITRFLNIQMSGCTTEREQLDYMKEALHILMDKRDYAGPVLAWGMDYIGSLANSKENNEKLQDAFTDLILRALSRTHSNKKEADATWAALGEAINAATENGDRRSFQAIGNLAKRKCRKKFPKNKFKFKALPGQVVSAKGLIKTPTTLSPNQVPHCCLHWGVLQRTGGSIPTKFAGQDGMQVMFDNTYVVNGLVALFNGKVKNNRPFYMLVSEDGSNWSKIDIAAEVSGAVVRVDARKMPMAARYVKLIRDGGMKYEDLNMVGFYVYGKPMKKKQQTAPKKEDKGAVTAA